MKLNDFKMKKRKIKTPLSNILLLIGTIILTLILFEITFRIINIDDTLFTKEMRWNHWMEENWEDEYNKRYEYDEDIGYINSKIKFEIEMFNRNKKNRTRILILGDSVMEFSKIEQILRNKLKNSTKNYIFLNTGTMGYDLNMEYELLEKYYQEIRPDQVIVLANPNDILGTPLIVKQPDGSWVAYERKNIANKFRIELFRKFATYRLVATTLMRSQNKNSENFYEYMEEPIEKLLDMEKEQQFKLNFIFMPLLEQQESELGKIVDETIIKLHQNINLQTKSTLLKPVFQQYNISEITRDMFHTNEKGDKIIAEEMAKIILNN